jgi:hypothetical protein
MCDIKTNKKSKYHELKTEKYNWAINIKTYVEITSAFQPNIDKLNCTNDVCKEVNWICSMIYNECTNFVLSVKAYKHHFL